MNIRKIFGPGFLSMVLAGLILPRALHAQIAMPTIAVEECDSTEIIDAIGGLRLAAPAPICSAEPPGKCPHLRNQRTYTGDNCKGDLLPGNPAGCACIFSKDPAPQAELDACTKLMNAACARFNDPVFSNPPTDPNHGLLNCVDGKNQCNYKEKNSRCKLTKQATTCEITNWRKGKEIADPGDTSPCSAQGGGKVRYCFDIRAARECDFACVTGKPTPTIVPAPSPTTPYPVPTVTAVPSSTAIATPRAW